MQNTNSSVIENISFTIMDSAGFKYISLCSTSAIYKTYCPANGKCSEDGTSCDVPPSPCPSGELICFCTQGKCYNYLNNSTTCSTIVIPDISFGGGYGDGGDSNGGGPIPYVYPCVGTQNNPVPFTATNNVADPGDCPEPTEGDGWIPLENVSVQYVSNLINPNFPCLVNAFNDITQQRLTNCIYQIYSNTFVGIDKIHNLEILSTNPLLDNNNNPVPAKSRVKPNDNTTYQIALNEVMGFEFTKEYWSSIILHELVHGFIQKNELNFSPQSQFGNIHQLMLTTWVNEIKEALLDIYPTMSEQDALCLSINEMSDMLTDDVNQTFKYQMTQWMQQYYNVNANLLGQTTEAYSSGTKGTPCS